MAETKTLAIVILNWNGLRWTERCLQSLQQSHWKNFDVLVLDNGSTKNESLVLREHFGTFAQIERSPVNLGFAGGNNFVIQRWLQPKPYHYYLLLNQDTAVATDCIDQLVDYLDQHPAVAVVGPKVLGLNGVTVQSVGADINRHTGQVISRYQGTAVSTVPTAPQHVAAIIGNCFMVRADVWKTIGGFNEDYFAYYEEADWCVRAQQAGYSCVVIPTASVRHGKSGGFRTYLVVRNMIWFQKTFSSPGQLVWFWFYFWCYFFPQRLTKGSPLSELLRASLHGWLGVHKGQGQ